MNIIHDILVSLVGGRGGEASDTVVRFLLPALFWFLLTAFIVREAQRKKEREEFEVKLEEQRRRFEGVNAALEERISSVAADVERREWFNLGLNALNIILRGEKSSAELGNRLLAFLVDYLEAGAGALYLYDDRNEVLSVISTFALSGAQQHRENFALGEGLAGQAARERKMIHLNEVPSGYLPISSALGEADPLDVVVAPLMNDRQLVGVIEIGSFKTFNPDKIEFLNLSTEGIAIAFSAIRSREFAYKLLEQTREQAEELRIQQAERQSNEESCMRRA